MRNRVVFVLNMDANGLGISRSLGRIGIPVVGIDFKSGSPGLRSRYVRPLVCADPVTESDRVLDLLIDEGSRLDEKGIIFPTSDAFLLMLSRNRKRLEDSFDFIIPPEKIIEGMINKSIQYREATRLGIPIPETYFPSSMDELNQIARDIPYPAIIKPLYSHLWFAKFGNKGFKVRNPEELKEKFRRAFDSGLIALVQSCIVGPNTNHVKVCAYYGNDSRIRAVFLTRKLRQFPTEFGIGSLMKSVHNEEVQALGLQMFEGVDYRGIGSIEFKLDNRDGRYKMIELNARPWLQNSQAACAGVDFSYIEYRNIAENHYAPPPEWQDGVIWVDVLEDLKSFMWYRKREMAKWPELFSPWLSANCHAYLARDDMRPAFSNLECGIQIARVIADSMRTKSEERNGSILTGRH